MVNIETNANYLSKVTAVVINIIKIESIDRKEILL